MLAFGVADFFEFFFGGFDFVFVAGFEVVFVDVEIVICERAGFDG